MCQPECKICGIPLYEEEVVAGGVCFDCLNRKESVLQKKVESDMLHKLITISVSLCALVVFLFSTETARAQTPVPNEIEFWVDWNAPYDNGWTHWYMRSAPDTTVKNSVYYRPGIVPSGGPVNLSTAWTEKLYKAEVNHVIRVDSFQVVMNGDFYSFLKSDWFVNVCSRATVRYQKLGDNYRVWIQNPYDQKVVLDFNDNSAELEPFTAQWFDVAYAGFVNINLEDGRQCATLFWREPGHGQEVPPSWEPVVITLSGNLKYADGSPMSSVTVKLESLEGLGISENLVDEFYEIELGETGRDWAITATPNGSTEGALSVRDVVAIVRCWKHNTCDPFIVDTNHNGKGELSDALNVLFEIIGLRNHPVVGSWRSMPVYVTFADVMQSEVQDFIFAVAGDADLSFGSASSAAVDEIVTVAQKENVTIVNTSSAEGVLNVEFRMTEDSMEVTSVILDGEQFLTEPLQIIGEPPTPIYRMFLPVTSTN